MTAESHLNSDFKDILDHFPAGCQIIDFDWRYRYVNAIGAQQAHQAPDELLGQKITDVYPSLQETPAFQTLAQCMTARTSATLTHEFVYPDNTSAWFELHVQPIPDGLLVMSADVAERQRSEVALSKSTRALKLLSECNQLLARIDDEQRLLAEICRLIVERGSYRLAWVGLAEQDPAKTIRPIAQVGFEDGYLDRAQITWADNERGRGPTGTAVRTGVVQINQDFLTNPAMAPWREAARTRGYQSSIALPLKDTISTFGVLNIYSTRPDAFDADEARLLTELANDLAYGLNALRARVAHQQAEKALQDSENRYRRITECLTDYQYSVRVEHGRPVETVQSPTCLTVTGYTAEEFAADPYLWIHMVAPEDRELVVERVRQILAGTEIPPIEHRIRHKGGETRWVSDTIILFKDAAGNLLSYDGVIKDITDRKLTEEALRASEKRFRALVENSADVIALLTGEGIILYESPAVKRVLGYQPDEMVGHNGFEFLHPGDYTISQELFGKLLQPHHVPVKTELRYKRKDGTWAWVQATGTNLLSEPSVQAIVINYQDITERKRATEALREVNETLQALFDHSPLAIITLDLNSRVRLWNKAAERMYGWTASEVVGQFLPTIPASKAEEHHAIFQRVIRGESITYLEVERQRKDGSGIFIGLSVAPLRDAAGHNYAQMSIAVDITERKQRERELEVIALMATALRAAPSRGDMLPVIVDQTLAILQGKGAALVMDRPATDEAIVVLARGDWAAQTGQRTRRQHSLAGRIMLTGLPSIIHDVRTKLPEVEVAAFQSVTAVAGVPLVAQVETIGALLIGRATPITFGELRVLQAIADIAANALHRASIVETLEQRVIERTQDLSAVNAQLAAANERLQELDRLKSKFVSDVSHELRTPITVLSLNVDLLEHGKPEKRGQYLEAIRQQVQRQAQLLEDILNLSRLELGAGKVRFAPVALNALIAQVVTVHQPAAEAKNLTLTFTPYNDLPVVPGEENQLAQVITNLIGNAINYTLTGKIEVNTSSNEREVVIEVRDTGLGIDPEDLPHLFERFYRGSRTRDTRGTGLGLAIVKEIVDLHDGRVEVESRIDVGTTVRVFLPLAARA